MDRKTLKALIDAGAIRRARLIGDGPQFRLEVDTQQGPQLVYATTGKLRTWATLDAAAKWVRSLGVGTVALELGNWQPEQRMLKL
jgi:hypothetical protein